MVLNKNEKQALLVFVFYEYIHEETRMKIKWDVAKAWREMKWDPVLNWFRQNKTSWWSGGGLSHTGMSLSAIVYNQNPIWWGFAITPGQSKAMVPLPCIGCVVLTVYVCILLIQDCCSFTQIVLIFTYISNHISIIHECMCVPISINHLPHWEFIQTSRATWWANQEDYTIVLHCLPCDQNSCKSV